MSNYAEIICGDIDEVKKSLVKEFRANRLRMNISPDAVDETLGIKSEWLGVEEIENNPLLFSYDFWQMLEFDLYSQRPWKYFDVPHATGEYVEDIIYGCSQNDPRILEQAIREFRAAPAEIRMKINLRERLKHMAYARGNIERDYINSISSNGYARMYIFYAIMQEMARFDALHTF